jgi:hypothetical protein
MMHLEQLRNPRAPMALASMHLPEGDPGVELTVAHMRRLIDLGKKDPTVHETAAAILQQCRVRAFDWQGEARAIYNWVLRNIRFTRDVYGKETLHAAPEILRLRIGDCDDFTILICSLLGTIGHKTRIVTIAGHPEDPTQFSHVFPEVLIGDRWIPVDAARRSPAFGKGPRQTWRRREWSTSSDDFIDVQGLAGPAGFLPSRPPRAYNPWVPDPRFRNLGALAATAVTPIPQTPGHGYTMNPPRRDTRYRQNHIRGMGHYGGRALRGTLGQDDSFNWATLPADIAAAGTAATNIVAVSRANPLNLTNPNALASGLTPAAQVALAQSGSSVPGYPFGVNGPSTTTLLMLGAALAAVLVISREE